MRRVVVTGMGIVSCLGNDLDSVSVSLREGRSGITFRPESAEAGLRSQMAGVPQIDLDAEIDRKQKRFMGDAAGFACVAMRDAIADAGLTPESARGLPDRQRRLGGDVCRSGTAARLRPARHHRDPECVDRRLRRPHCLCRLNTRCSGSDHVDAAGASRRRPGLHGRPWLRRSAHASRLRRRST